MFNKIVDDTILPNLKAGLNSTFFKLLETPANSSDITNEIVYMVEDQKTKTNPTATPWRLFISIRRNKKDTITIHYDLEITLSKAVNINDILNTLENPYLANPTLTIPNNSYQLRLTTTIDPSKTTYQTHGLTKIIFEIYKTEIDPNNFNNLISETIEYF